MLEDKKEKESSQHIVESVGDDEILAAQKAWNKTFNDLPNLKEHKHEVYVYRLVNIKILDRFMVKY